MSPDSSLSATPLPPFLSTEAFVADSEQFEAYKAPEEDALQRRARTLLSERMGTADIPVSTAYACGTVGVQADQTHYSDGFGLFLPLQHGVAVAARYADTTRITFAGAEETWTDDTNAPPPWLVAVRRILQELLAEQQVEVAVASTVPGVCRDGYLAALAVAVMRVVRALDVSTAIDLNSVQSLRDDLVPLLAGEIGSALNMPYSTGYLLATFGGPEPPFTLVDTTTREHLPVETEARTALRWAVLDPRASAPQSAKFHRKRQAQAREALRRLRENGFDRLTSFRELEHRDLEDAVAVLPDALHAVVRHLVTENRRVQKHVAAMRRSDWQMIGALLLMSHASQRDQWTGTSTAVNRMVAEAESRTHDGLYGACMTGRSGAVLVAGRPSTFERELHRLSAEIADAHGHAPEILAP
jgi:galactokinase